MDVARDGIDMYATRLFTKEATRLIAEHNTSKPMFLYLAHLAVHVGNYGNALQAPQETIDLFSYIEDPDRRVFAAMITELDRSVGAVVQALKDRGMLENSIILFTTDNGGCPAPYESSGGWAPEYDVVMGPTGRDGKYDLRLVLESDVAFAFSSIGHPLSPPEVIMSLRNDATLTCDPEAVEWTCRAAEGETCLFDVKLDPCESVDVAEQHPLVLAAMLQLIETYNATAVPPRNQPCDPNSNPIYWNYLWTTWSDFPPKTNETVCENAGYMLD
ncbi:hypothetical protein B566_EDAN014851 [Ephemera danica]|nr:hypothetical protein B566_EDAN014851 [Ephemera danica]